MTVANYILCILDKPTAILVRIDCIILFYLFILVEIDCVL